MIVQLLPNQTSIPKADKLFNFIDPVLIKDAVTNLNVSVQQVMTTLSKNNILENQIPLDKLLEEKRLAKDNAKLDYDKFLITVAQSKARDAANIALIDAFVA
jgi:antitoxin component of RelBE/YafQ-DinJ toxin-antitoxin module